MNRFTSDRVNEFQLPSMQAHRFGLQFWVRLFACIAKGQIEWVVFDREAKGRQMQSDLMRSPCLRDGFDDRSAIGQSLAHLKAG